jgi:uncharacterized repeat protein (TIGR03803 family)
MRIHRCATVRRADTVIAFALVMVAAGATKAQTYTLTTIANFDPATGVYFPKVGVTVDGSGNIFGATDGAAGGVYEIAAGSDTVTPVSLFSGVPPSGSTPSGVVLDGSGNLFGTTQFGGGASAEVGSVFEIAKSSHAASTLFAFNDAPGANPVSSVTLDAAGDIFGTTQDGGEGGGNGDGTVFEIPASTGVLTTLWSFDLTDGFEPQAGLTLDSSGDVFGTTAGGGAGPGAGVGTVFEIDPSADTFRTLASFEDTNGSDPLGDLVLDGSGDLFGTSFGGGTDNAGTVFEIVKNSGVITTLASFDGADGYGPEGGLVRDAHGDLFGTTQAGGAPGDLGGAGGAGDGTVFELAAGSGTITTLAAFDGTDGEFPYSGLVVDSGGNLYGTTQQGGTDGVGTVFELTAAAPEPGALALLVALAPAALAGVRRRRIIRFPPQTFRREKSFGAAATFASRPS